MVKKRLAVAVPASVISDTPHLREKTSKIGCIGRAAAIFKVNEVIVYADDPKVNQRRDIELIATLLSYMETPQYLRKRLFELKPELQFAGILPPLRTPHHPLKGKTHDLKAGEYREGVAVAKVKEGVLVDIGVEHPALLRDTQVAVNNRLTLKITKLARQVEVKAASRDEIPEYWGYTVSVKRRGLRSLLGDQKFELTIGTSKFATRFQDAAERLAEKWKKANSILLLFGAPTRGLFEIAKDEGANLNNLVDFVLNTVPNQGTETVRTEEALLASLAILNIQFDFQ
jgi:predicted SPOUT superfamily RNA methylase MTH1